MSGEKIGKILICKHVMTLSSDSKACATLPYRGIDLHFYQMRMILFIFLFLFFRCL